VGVRVGVLVTVVAGLGVLVGVAVRGPAVLVADGVAVADGVLVADGVAVGVELLIGQVLPGSPRQKLGAAEGAVNVPSGLCGLIAARSQWKRYDAAVGRSSQSEKYTYSGSAVVPQVEGSWLRAGQPVS
jgi:hypothetical protein